MCDAWAYAGIYMLSGDSCQKDRVEVSRIMKVRIENVTKKIKGVTILDNVSCEFEGGKIYGITGANGSGKTMLLRLIAGLIKADSGCVYIDDKILKKDIDHPENIGVLIENPNFWKRYTGMETLKLLADIRKQATEDDIKNALVRVGLEPSDKRVVRKYSLGMRQKLGIAQAIMENRISCFWMSLRMLLIKRVWNRCEKLSMKKRKEAPL